MRNSFVGNGELHRFGIGDSENDSSFLPPLYFPVSNVLRSVRRKVQGIGDRRISLYLLLLGNSQLIGNFAHRRFRFFLLSSKLFMHQGMIGNETLYPVQRLLQVMSVYSASVAPLQRDSLHHET